MKKMKIGMSLLVAALCAASPSSARAGQSKKLEILAGRLEGNPGGVSMEEMWPALREMPLDPDENSFYGTTVFREACGQARAEDLPELARIFGKMPDSYFQSMVFSTLADAWMRLKVPEKLPERPEFPVVKGKMPKLPADYPPELKAAIQRYLNVVEPFNRLMKKREDSGISFGLHEKEYWQSLEDVLQGKNNPEADKIFNYVWGSWCGTGSEVFIVPQSFARPLVLAADRRWAEAMGAALWVRGVTVDGIVQLLSAGVPDPSKVVAGALAFYDADPDFYVFDRVQTPMLATLLRMKGDERVDLLRQLAAHAPGETQNLYFTALGRLAGDAAAADSSGGFSGGDLFGEGTLDQISPWPVSVAAQKQVREFLCAQQPADLSIDAGEELASILKGKNWPGANAALRRLLDHPSIKVAERAASALKEAGEVVEIPPKLGSVRCRIVVDGKPYASKRVQWSVGWGHVSTSSDKTTDADGIVEVPRDHFIDKKSRPVREFALRSRKMGGFDDPWFSVILPPPPADDGIIAVNVETKPLRVEFSRPRTDEELKDKKVEVTLSGAQSQSNLGYWDSARLQTTRPGDLPFTALMPGVYQLEVRVPGSTVWSGEVRVGKTPQITIPLRRASAVRYAIKVPKEWPPIFLLPELRQDGKEQAGDFDYEKSLLRGVPAGKYVLHLPSLAEVKKRTFGELGWTGPDFDGVDVPFEVKDDSPLEIDLGEIEMKAKGG